MIPQKVKYLVIGIIIGALLSSAVVLAEPAIDYILKKAEYPIVVNGTQYNDNELPVLNYNGSTYVPLKKVADLLGTKVNWNNELKRVEIGESQNNPSDNIKPAPSNISTPQATSSEMYTRDNLTFVKFDNIEYVSVPDIDGLVSSKGYAFGYDSNSGTTFLAYNPNPFHPTDKYTTILNNIPTKIAYGRRFIDYNFYLHQIVPLIK